MPSREYFVIDATGHVSFDVHTQMPDAFAKLGEAQQRAHELARSEPGQTVVIAQAVAYVTCPEPEVRERKLRIKRRRPHARTASKPNAGTQRTPADRD